MWDCVGNDVWQQWTIGVDSSTGAATFKNVGSGKCLDDSGRLATGATPQISDCDGSNTHQKWRVTGGWWKPLTTVQTHDNDAYVLFAENGLGNLALDSASSYTNGSKLRLAPTADTNIDDYMRIVPGSAANTFIMKFMGGNGNKCLDNPWGQAANGTALQLEDCTGGANQNWYVNTMPYFGGLQFRNQQSGKCLDSTGFNGTDARADGTTMVIYDCSLYAGAQNWEVTVD